MKHRVLYGLLAAGLGIVPSKAAVDFDRDVRPILSDHCFACHGPDDKTRMMGLRLDTREGLFVKHGAEPVIVPGDAAKSKLFQKVSATDPKRRMPPVSSGRSLTPQQVETLKAWINQGAKWELHWSYIPPKRPELPAVADKGWVRNPIDAFILSRLEKEGLKP